MVIVCILQISAELVKTTWMQVIWVPERKGTCPLKGISKPFPRLEYIERKKEQKEPCSVEILPYSSELYDKLEKWNKTYLGLR